MVKSLKFQYICHFYMWLTLLNDYYLHGFVTFPDVLVTVGSTAILTSNIIFKCFYLSIIYVCDNKGL